MPTFQKLILTEPEPHIGLITALQKISGTVPEDPDAAMQYVQALKAAATRGAQAESTQLVQAREDVRQKSQSVEQNRALVQKWKAIDGELAGIEILNRYTELRRTAMEGAVPLEKLRIAHVEVKEGFASVTADGPAVGDPHVLDLIKRSSAQTSGILGLRVFGPQGFRAEFLNLPR